MTKTMELPKSWTQRTAEARLVLDLAAADHLRRIEAGPGSKYELRSLLVFDEDGTPRVLQTQISYNSTGVL